MRRIAWCAWHLEVFTRPTFSDRHAQNSQISDSAKEHLPLETTKELALADCEACLKIQPDNAKADGISRCTRCPVLIGVDRCWSVLYVACLLSALWILWQIPRLNFLALSWCGKPNAIDLQLGIGYDFHLFLASHWWMVDGLWWFMMVAGSGFELPQMFPDRCRDPCGGVASPKFGAARPRGRRETSKPRWGAVKRVTRMRHDVEFAAQLHSFTDKLSQAEPRPSISFNHKAVVVPVVVPVVVQCSPRC